MAISEDEVAHIAALARLHLDAGERAAMAQELARILDYVARIDELDLVDVPPTSHVETRDTPLRDDFVVESDVRHQVLDGAPDVEALQFRVPKVV